MRVGVEFEIFEEHDELWVYFFVFVGFAKGVERDFKDAFEGLLIFF